MIALRFCCLLCRRVCSPRRAIMFAIITSLFVMLDLLVNTEMDTRRERISGIAQLWKPKVDKQKDHLKSFGKGFSHRRPKVIKVRPPPLISNFTSIEGDLICLKQGTKHVKEGKCICKDGWFEKSCNIPESIHFSNQIQTKFLYFRRTARRIVYAVPFNHEFAMLEALLHDLYDLVDVFIIMESPYTAFGVRKPIRLLPWLHRGYLRMFHPKMMYLYLDHFPTGGKKHGHFADAYLRTYLGKRGMPFIKNLADDDLFMVLDIDEIPSRDSLIFLKVHNRYPEPFGFRFRWSAFGYFWKHRHYSQVTAGCTIGMLKKVYHNDSNMVRDIHHGVIKNRAQELMEYRQTTLVRAWFLGEVGHFAGWHCSSCFKLEGIRIKFMSAQNADWPRWGSIPEKMDLRFLRNMVRQGIWFNGAPLNDRAVAKMADQDLDDFYAPPYILRHPEKFKYLLKNIYLKDDDDEKVSSNIESSLGHMIQTTVIDVLLFSFGIVLLGVCNY